MYMATRIKCFTTTTIQYVLLIWNTFQLISKILRMGKCLIGTTLSYTHYNARGTQIREYWTSLLIFVNKMVRKFSLWIFHCIEFVIFIAFIFISHLSQISFFFFFFFWLIFNAGTWYNFDMEFFCFDWLIFM